MNRRSIVQISAVTALGFVMSPSSAMAQAKSLKDQLVGTWTLSSAEPYGTNPKGSYMFDSNGRFSAILMRNDLPKYTSNSRTQGTPAEYKATVDGSIAYFGSYSITGTDLDLLDAFEAMIPKLRYRHPHNPEHVPDHILSALIGTSIVLPFQNGDLLLGQWQRVVLIELDGPRTREIAVTVIPHK